MEALALLVKNLCIKPDEIHIFHSWGKDVLMKDHPVYQEFFYLNGKRCQRKN